jgi:stress response protein YsnF/sporulation protein YlmC with PRC-barrel domain
MGLMPLSKMDDYELVDKDQDLRGWQVQDASGRILGRVAEMMVDTAKDRVTTLLLDNNAEYSIEDVELGDHTLLLGPQVQANVVPLDGNGATSGKVATTVERSAPTDAAGAVASELRMPVIEEQLRVGKRQVDKGGVRVTRRVQDRPVQKQVELREEHVNVTRRPADRLVDPAAVGTLAELDIEVVEKAEVPVVIKQERVVEEVVVKKEATERSQTVRDVVRRADVEVYEISNPPRPPSRPV